MCEQILVVRIFCIIFAREENNNITMNRIIGITEESTLREIVLENQHILNI